jgi:hypothetical protein
MCAWFPSSILNLGVPVAAFDSGRRADPDIKVSSGNP